MFVFSIIQSYRFLDSINSLIYEAKQSSCESHMSLTSTFNHLSIPFLTTHNSSEFLARCVYRGGVKV